MRRRFSLLILLATALLMPSAGWADTFILKSGEKLEGKIVKETPTDYTIDYKAGAGIFDTRTVLKSDVEKVEKEMPDEVTWQTLKTVKPGAGSLPASGYDGPMHLLQNFITQYPQSPHAGEAAQALLAFEEEKKRIAGGEAKIEGRWISQEEVEKERYQINGRATFNYMEDLARHADLVGALNTFDQLEKNYPGSSVYPDAIGLARQLVDKLRTTADQTLKTWQFQKAQREAATKLMPDTERAQTTAAQLREQQQFDAAFEASTKSNVKWPPLQKQNEKSLAAIISKAPPELTRLDNLPVAKMRQSLQLSEKGRAALAQQNLEIAEPALAEANKLWPANELAARLRKEITVQKAAAKAATPVPVVVVATPTPHAATPAPEKAAATPPPLPPPDEPKGFLTTTAGRGLLALGLILLVGGYLAYKKKKAAAEKDLG